jgi:polysaccharide biosynthesis/export protein
MTAIATLVALQLAVAVPQAPQAAPSPKPGATSPLAGGGLPAVSQAAGGDYQVGPGDVLNVLVFGHPDLSRSAPIQPNGVIALPLLREVPVSGLTVTEIQRKITTLLERDFLVNPQVEVTVANYQSNYVILMGEVNSPGRKLLRGKTRLIDLLIEAGGFRPGASGDITITRTEGTFDGGSDTLQLRINSGAMTSQDRVNLEFVVKNGDFIMVAPKNYVSVEGEVARPGRYAIEANFNVTAAVAAAGGATRFGGGKITLRRTDSETGKVQVIEVDLKAVRKGEKPDIALQPNDVVTVPRKRF